MTLPPILDFPPLPTARPDTFQDEIQNKEDLWQNRLAIEHGRAPSWSGRERRAFHLAAQYFLIPALRCGLNALGLLTQGWSNALAPQISRQRFVMDTLPESFCGLKILQLSDLHVDGISGLAEQIVECIRPLAIDLCDRTGDYRFRVSGPCDGIYPAMEKMLEGLHPRLGTFGILGNHDVSEGVAEMEQLGIKMLVNDAVEIQEGAESL